MPEIKAIVEIHEENDNFVVTDLLTYVSDFGKTKQEAIERLKEGLLARYQSITERKDSNLVEVKVHV